MPLPVFREADNGRTVNEEIGGRFCVELVENGTTGYTWSRPEFDETRLLLESDESVPAPGGAIGAGGVRRFVFQTKAAGLATVRLAYRRPWETDTAPAARFELTIVGSP
jgi:inhibitor of cysteine peptidase